jgi:hypothetical protein
MPPVINKKSYKSTNPSFDKDYTYDYPDGLDLKPGSTLHNKIRDEVMRRALSSATVMSNRYGDWQDIDHTLTAYIPTDEKEELLKKGDSRKPVSIVFPYSYTVLETLLSFFVAAFLQDPIFRYEGVGPDDVVGAILLEKLIALQCNKNKVGLNLHTMARDAFAYGFGVVAPVWRTEYGKKSVLTKVGGFMGFGGRDEYQIQDNQLLFEGNALDNIDPYLYLPDTTVPIHSPQEGEFVGWFHPISYLNLLNEERNSDGTLFNCKYLQGLERRQTHVTLTDNSGRNTKTGMNQYNIGQEFQTSTMYTVRMYVTLIPEEWGLGEGKYPEKWYFEVGQEEIVISARPAGLDHNKYPVAVIAPDTDGYSVSPVSRIEILYGMQGILDFLFNSHVKNVRKAINDMFIYDPYQVNSNDLKHPGEGKLIRLRRPAWGKGVKDVIQQLGVTDVTRGNVADSSFIVQWMDRISGADSSMQGALRQGGPDRLTGAEFQGTRAGGIGRLERISRIVGLQGIQDIGTFFGLHNKQMMRSESYVKISGDWQDVLLQEFGQTQQRGRVTVSPDQVNILYNIIVRDGTIPGGNFSDAWVQLFQILAGNQELAQKFDVVRIFSHIARNMGAKNVNDFVRRGGGIAPTTADNESVRRQMDAGNLVPMGAV